MAGDSDDHNKRTRVLAVKLMELCNAELAIATNDAEYQAALANVLTAQQALVAKTLKLIGATPADFMALVTKMMMRGSS